MQICITQRDGIRYFSRFKNIPERDKLEIELTVLGDRVRVYKFDLTETLFERFNEHPEILHRKRVVERDPLLAKRPSRARKPAPKPPVTIEEPVAMPVTEPVAMAEPPKKRATRKPKVVELVEAAPTIVRVPAAKPRTKAKSEPIVAPAPVKAVRTTKKAAVPVVETAQSPKPKARRSVDKSAPTAPASKQTNSNSGKKPVVVDATAARTVRKPRVKKHESVAVAEKPVGATPEAKRPPTTRAKTRVPAKS